MNQPQPHPLCHRQQQKLKHRSSWVVLSPLHPPLLSYLRLHFQNSADHDVVEELKMLSHLKWSFARDELDLILLQASPELEKKEEEEERGES
ncbi:hypothetical protein LINPERHAP1_LOCUS6002 [Linum perenne]